METNDMTLIVRPMTLGQLNALVSAKHRHHRPVQGHRFSIGLWDTELAEFTSGCSVGRPVSRHCDPYNVAEVTRLVTDGTPNACSALYGAAARTARSMGFTQIQTFILASEPGTSLRASGWQRIRESPGGTGWTSRPGRTTEQPTEPKVLWVLSFHDHIVHNWRP